MCFNDIVSFFSNVHSLVLDIGIAMATYVVGEEEGSVLVCVEAEANLTSIPILVVVTTQDQGAVGECAASSF